MTAFLSLHRVGLLAVLLLFGFASALHAQSFTTFDVSGSSNTFPAAISASGYITGSTHAIGSERSYGFVREPNGTITTFDVPNVIEQVPGCPADDWTIFFTMATDINFAGEVVGRYMQASVSLLPNCTRLRGFLRKRNGTFTTFGGEWWPQFLSQEQANWVGLATGNVTINEIGHIAGYYGTDFEELGFVGFLRKRDGNITTFGLPDKPAPNIEPITIPTAINVLDVVTGYWYDGITDRGFLRKRNGTIIKFDVPGSTDTNPTGIDWASNITGYFQDANFNFLGFLRKRDGTFITFDVAGSGQTFPVAINAIGQITGVYLDSGFVYHGFLREHDGTISTVDVPGSIYTSPTGINALGDITGSYTDASGRVHGFVRSAR